MFMQMDHFTWVGKMQTTLHKEKMERKSPQGQSPKFFADLLPASEESQRQLGVECGLSGGGFLQHMSSGAHRCHVTQFTERPATQFPFIIVNYSEGRWPG